MIEALFIEKPRTEETTLLHYYHADNQVLVKPAHLLWVPNYLFMGEFDILNDKPSITGSRAFIYTSSANLGYNHLRTQVIGAHIISSFNVDESYVKDLVKLVNSCEISPKEYTHEIWQPLFKNYNFMG